MSRVKRLDDPQPIVKATRRARFLSFRNSRHIPANSRVANRSPTIPRFTVESREGDAPAPREEIAQSAKIAVSSTASRSPSARFG